MLSLASILGLPNSTYGHALSYLLPLSTAFPSIHLALVAHNLGWYQATILFAIGPVTLLHHLITFILLVKNRSYNVSVGHGYIPWCLTREGNIVFLVLLDGAWISGTAVGFWFYSFLNGSVDDGFEGWRPLVSTVIGLLEAVTLLGIVVVCFLGRRERVKGMKDQGLVRMNSREPTSLR
ncbi:hypothetical protein BDV93DRAFT_588331 [Ceratobasidium sp. AG-I]|nr:hypothetical protein BDV93DRAFT_588331 [Ceratobasidium sp. AG-I]